METTKAIQEKFPQHVLKTSDASGYETLWIKPEGLSEVCLYLRDHLQYSMLMDLSCVDYLKHPDYRSKPARFEVFHNLYSLDTKKRVFLKVPVPEEKPVVPSVSSLWAAADWYEREVWDMFGVRFEGHPNMKRLLMYEEFQGHALRKDYRHNKRQPLIGPVN